MGCPSRSFEFGDDRLVAGDFALYSNCQEDAVDLAHVELIISPR
jgi:hypothetical protein